MSKWAAKKVEKKKTEKFVTFFAGKVADNLFELRDPRALKLISSFSAVTGHCPFRVLGWTKRAMWRVHAKYGICLKSFPWSEMLLNGIGEV
ncbi:hypothetical protein Trydic_g17961 [Trypoxylus dichotomus]